MITLAVDCMGGDHGPTVTLAACNKFLDAHADAEVLLVGRPEALASFSHPRARIIRAARKAAPEPPPLPKPVGPVSVGGAPLTPAAGSGA